MPIDDNYECIKLEVGNGIATLTLNRPDKLNAFNNTMTKEIEMVLDDASQNDDIRVIVVTGAGRGFCSGADVSNMSARKEPRSRRSPLTILGDFGLSLARFEKPIIAAINGVAAGAGLSIAVLCDIRIAAEDARFAASWVKRGLIPDVGATYLLPKLIGIEKAYELMYTGDIIDAATAKEIGLVSHVVPQDELMRTANELATKVAKGPPIAMQLIKRVVFRSMLEDLTSQFVFETYAQNICYSSEDYKEGVASFMEKREAQFKGI